MVQLNTTLEELNFSKEEGKIFLVDCENMYPQIKSSLVQKAILNFAKRISKASKTKLKLLLKMIHFKIKSKCMSFQG